MTWQHRIGEMFAGKYATDWMWNIVDVRDTADAQRRMAESPVAENGSRYLGWSPSDGAESPFFPPFSLLKPIIRCQDRLWISISQTQPKLW